MTANLAPTERRILAILEARRGQVLGSREILRELYPDEIVSKPAMVAIHQHVWSMRQRGAEIHTAMHHRPEERGYYVGEEIPAESVARDWEHGLAYPDTFGLILEVQARVQAARPSAMAVAA